uniref:Uncharacterized protein n=1 Tax=Strigops habroptila TaxID=2489341 RepID=A0A672U015_STRHB
LGSDIKILEDQFDKLIVVTTTKRKQWPKRILVHATRTMKAEQELLVSILYDKSGFLKSLAEGWLKY